MPSQLTSGTKLERYEILSLLGEGGMGEVYRARDVKLKRDVAVKVLPAAFSADTDRLRRFEQEAPDEPRHVGDVVEHLVQWPVDVDASLDTHGGAPSS